MEIDRIFIIMIIGFSLLGGLTLLSYSASAIKLHQKQMEFLREAKKRAEQKEAARLAAMEGRIVKEPQLPYHSRKTT